MREQCQRQNTYQETHLGSQDHFHDCRYHNCKQVKDHYPYHCQHKCSIDEKIHDIIIAHCLGHFNFSCADHPHPFLIHSLEYCICLQVLDNGWLTFDQTHLTVLDQMVRCHCVQFQGIMEWGK